MTIAVKRYASTMTGAPTLSGTAGAAVTLLNACLVDGFNVKAVSSAAHTAGVATVATSSDHGYAVHDVIALSGANESAWNDEFRVLTVPDSTHFTFAIASGTATPATGTLSAKIAPLGWSKPFSGTNKAAYLPKAGYVQRYLRVRDDATTPPSASGRWAVIRGYEAMTAIDTGTGLFPTSAQSTNGLILQKSSTSDATARAWWLVGDGGIFYLGTAWYAPDLDLVYVTAFGDINSLRAADGYSSLIVAALNENDYSYFGNFGDAIETQAAKYLARGYAQTGTAIAAGMVGDNGVSVYLGRGGYEKPSVSGRDLLFSPVAVVAANEMRSRALPGLYQPLHTQPLTDYDLVGSIPDLPGRSLWAVPVGGPYFGGPGQALFDITGPWR